MDRNQQQPPAETAEALQERVTALTALFHRAEHELEEHKRRMSLELHDEVGQVLTSVLLQLSILRESDDLEYIKGRIGGLHHITSLALEEVRQLSRSLRPIALEKLGLQAAVTAHVRDYEAATGITVQTRFTGLDAPLPGAVQTALYRAVQEGLTNAARHGAARQVNVTVTRKNNNVILQMEDDGKGMQPGAVRGLGLLGMEERARRLGGRFWCFNRVAGGFCINLLLRAMGEEKQDD